MRGSQLQIDDAEAFEHLANAPIVEAVIHWQARSNRKIQPDQLLEQLRTRLPDYPESHQQQELGIDTEIRPDGTSVRQRFEWQGFRLQTNDHLQIAQFTRNGFVFSRLKPYEDWDKFEAEASRLWAIYCELVDPSEVQRLGVRFINQFTPAHPSDYTELLAVPPTSPQELPLPLNGFMHQNTFDIPGYPYNLKVIQTIQPPNPPERSDIGLILDLDVFTNRPIQLKEVAICLREMHWVKNKAFFAFLTEKAISQFRD